MLGLQGYTQLAKFQSADVLGYMVAASLLRELGPVLAAILFASSAGGAMTSEIGLMKTTEQLEAMNVMAVNPVARVVVPRFLGGRALHAAFGLDFQCGRCVWRLFNRRVQWLGLDSGIFWSQMQSNISFDYDVLNGLIKSAVFGVAVTLIAVHQVFTACPHPRAFCAPAPAPWCVERTHRAGIGFYFNRIDVYRVIR